MPGALRAFGSLALRRFPLAGRSGAVTGGAVLLDVQPCGPRVEVQERASPFRLFSSATVAGSLSGRGGGCASRPAATSRRDSNASRLRVVKRSCQDARASAAGHTLAMRPPPARPVGGRFSARPYHRPSGPAPAHCRTLTRSCLALAHLPACGASLWLSGSRGS